MENLADKKFGKLRVLSFVERKNYNYSWLCQCDCGNQHICLASNLKAGRTTQCKQCANEQRKKHGHSSGNAKNKSGRSPTYNSWLGIFTRVRGKSEKLKYSYDHVRVCERWHDFKNFLADMGERPPGRTLDRIDLMGDYEPSNCRWATWKQQLANRRECRTSK